MSVRDLNSPIPSLKVDSTQSRSYTASEEAEEGASHFFEQNFSLILHSVRFAFLHHQHCIASLTPLNPILVHCWSASLLCITFDSIASLVSLLFKSSTPINMHQKSFVAAVLVASASLSFALPAPSDDVVVNPTHAVLEGFPFQARADNPFNINNTCGPLNGNRKCNNQPGGGQCCSEFVSILSPVR